MNTTPPTPTEVIEMRQFLARLIRIPLMSIKVTGDPATDENADLLEFYDATSDCVEMVKLCALEGMRIDSILAGEIDRLPDGTPDLVKGAEMFGQLVSKRAKLYP